MKKIIITKKKSHIGRKPSDKKTLLALGLKKINSSVVKDWNPQIKGMVESVSHLVDYEDFKK